MSTFIDNATTRITALAVEEYEEGYEAGRAAVLAEAKPRTELLAIYDNLDDGRQTLLADEAQRLLEDAQKELTAKAAAWDEDQRKA